MHIASNQQIDYCCHVKWEKTIAKKTDTLEEWDGSAEQLSIDCDHCTAKPHDAEYNLEKKSLIVCLCGDTQYSGKHQAEEEWAPKVPISNLFSFLFGVHFGNWIDYYP